jgi:hypothetical protein
MCRLSSSPISAARLCTGEPLCWLRQSSRALSCLPHDLSGMRRADHHGAPLAAAAAQAGQAPPRRARAPRLLPPPRRYLLCQQPYCLTQVSKHQSSLPESTLRFLFEPSAPRLPIVRLPYADLQPNPLQHASGCVLHHGPSALPARLRHRPGGRPHRCRQRGRGRAPAKTVSTAGFSDCCNTLIRTQDLS